MLPLFGLMTFSALLMTAHAGFDDPSRARELLQNIRGKPCDCKGGYAPTPPLNSFSSVSCLGAMAYRVENAQWVCVSVPSIIPSNRPARCPCTEFYSSMHSSCYSTYATCTASNRTFYYATKTRDFSGSTGGDWGPIAITGHSTKLMASSCQGTIGAVVCWDTQAPIHISDGGGPQDQARAAVVSCLAPAGGASVCP